MCCPLPLEAVVRSIPGQPRAAAPCSRNTREPTVRQRESWMRRRDGETTAGPLFLRIQPNLSLFLKRAFADSFEDSLLDLVLGRVSS
jgi:hypothetical protein